MNRRAGIPDTDDVAARLKRDADLREAATIAFLVIFGFGVLGLFFGICWLAGAMLGSS